MMQRLPRIPFSYAKANEILLQKSEDVEGVPSLMHSVATNLSVVQEICRLVGPIHRIEKSSEEVLAALNTAYSEGDLNASQVVDEVEEAVDLSRLLQEMPISEDLLEMNDESR